MESSPQKILDVRLASGEITEEEYRRLSNTIASKEVPKKEPTKKIESIATSEGIDMGKKLFVFDDHFILKGEKYEFSEISTAFLDAKILWNSFVKQTFTCFSLKLESGHIVKTRAQSIFVQGNKNNRMREGGSQLLSKSSQSRLQKILLEFAEKREIQIEGTKVTLFADGRISDGVTTISIRESAENENARIGTVDREWLARSSNNPDHIIIGKKGTSVFQERLSFKLTWNKDVYKWLIQAFMKEDDRLKAALLG